MAFQREYAARNITSVADGNLSLNKEPKSSSEPIITVPGNLNGCFDCNICLDTSHDPVVTLCGHLYCWPCIYKWLKVQNPSPEPNNQHKCPVCKSHISSTSLVPLYGRGTSPYDPEAENRKMAFDIPHRPQAPASNTFLASAASMSTDSSQQSRHNTFHHQQYISHPLNNYPSLTTSFYSPTIHMVGEMVFARIFGSSETNLFTYPSYSNSYAHPFSGNNGSPRLRRQEMQLDKSLTRVSVFLFCCIVLCLILF